MTISPGQRAQEFANSQMTRFIHRDLKQEIYGMINDFNHTGSRLVRHLLRNHRIDRHHTRAERHSYEENSLNALWEHPWKTIDSMHFVGMQYSGVELAVLLQHLEALRLQIPEIVDFHESFTWPKLSADIPISTLGKIGSPLKDFASSSLISAFK